MENKNMLIIGAVILLLLGGGYFLLKGQGGDMQNSNTVVNSVSPSEMAQTTSDNTQAPTISQKKVKNVTVEYNGQGFNPKSITVKAGDTVTWTNKDTDKLWVASNPHPTHTDYPGFDALKGIPTGETYSFTFTKAGKWGYHNHLEPDKKGEVIVEQ